MRVLPDDGTASSVYGCIFEKNNGSKRHLDEVAYNDLLPLCGGYVAISTVRELSGYYSTIFRTYVLS